MNASDLLQNKTDTPDQSARNPVADWFTIFWTIFPDDQDWANWIAAGRPRLMIVLSMLRGEQGDRFLRQLKERGATTLAVRIEEHEIYHTDPWALRGVLLKVPAAGLVLTVTFMGNEPDNGLKWHHRKPNEPPFDWGQNYGYFHADAIIKVTRALKGLDINDKEVLGQNKRPVGAIPGALVAPGWLCRNIWEWAEPQPGLITWRDIVRDAYWRANGFGLHSYTAYMDPKEDTQRHIKRLQQFLELFHMGPAYIDEFGVLIGPDLERFRFCIRTADRIYRHPIYGRMTALFSIFTSNGVPRPDPDKEPVWDPRYLIRDPECYRMLGRYLTQGIVP